MKWGGPRHSDSDPMPGFAPIAEMLAMEVQTWFVRFTICIGSSKPDAAGISETPIGSALWT